MNKETYQPHSPHNVLVVLRDFGNFTFEANLSGIINNPNRLWIEDRLGVKTYFMLDNVAYYVIGGE